VLAGAVRALGLLLLLVTRPVPGEGFQTPAISVADLAARRGTPEEPLVVDVRPFAEYKTGHVVGAVNMPHTELEKHLDRLGAAGNGVVLYCTMGKRTRLAEQTLLDHGIPNLFHLQGGLGAWRQGGHPITTGWGP
jgi:rhodanese-related sulfurtransferase